MRRRTAVRALGLLPLCAARPALTQTQVRHRVAWVSTDRKDRPSENLEAFRGGMRELGRVEGRDFAIEVWSGDGSGERVARMAPDIVGSRPDVIVAAGGLALFPLLRAGVTKPIVFSISADPVEAKIVASMARPGGNITGISLFTLALVGKRLELVKEILPGAKRVALIANPQHPGERKELEAAQQAAAKLRLHIRYFQARSGAELESALTDIARSRDDAVLAFADGFTLGFAGRLAEFSLQHRIPTVDGWAPFAQAGNVLIYGPVFADVYRRLAAFVDKILKGAKPGDLPIELPTKVELVINAKTAAAIGLTIPSAVLARADEVIR
ncbi:MAG: ABC transporter substrate-binding protein [Betaproteobacteria bacterium]|nr:ABC transporter substrate-binding protein [Betaproteobacteria bacterium]